MKVKHAKTDRLASLARSIARAASEKQLPKRKLNSATQMAYAYEEMLGEYCHKPISYVRNGKLDLSKRSGQTFQSAANLADKYKADYVDWCRAQFYFIHQWYGRACKIYELRGEKGPYPAPKRYREWCQMVRKGAISPTVSSIILAAPSIDTDYQDRVNNKRLRRLMESYQKSEAEVFEAFSHQDIFDRSWLNKHPIFLSLKQKNKI